jgi:hypothetical protein
MGLGIFALCTAAYFIDQWQERRRLKRYYRDDTKIPPIYIDHMDR